MDVKQLVNNKQLEVKNTVYLYSNEIEKLEKIKLNNIKFCLISLTILLAGISYVKKFTGLTFIVFIICSILTILIFIVDYYIKNKINHLKKEIKKLEQFFIELDNKKHEI